MAAPIATTSSGFTPLEGFLPKNFSTSSCILGILVEPPTKITSSTSLVDKLASLRAFFTGSIDLRTRPSANCSKTALDRDLTKCLGIPSTGIM